MRAEQGDVEVIREALLDSSNALVPGTMTEGAHQALAALDRLTAALERAERIVASVQSKTALDVVAEKMAAEDRVEKAELALAEMREALERIRENAKSWHGAVVDCGHAKALAVIAGWCDAALAARTEPDVMATTEIPARERGWKNIARGR